MITQEATIMNEKKYAALRSHRPSGVSQALRVVSVALDRVDVSPFPKQTDGLNYQIRVASTRKSRESAYRLAYDVYSTKGYVQPNEKRHIVSSYDARADALTLLAEDKSGEAVGTVSLVLDSEDGLPCDEIYGPELAELRSQGRRLLEVTRLAIDQTHAHSKQLLTLLCNAPFVYGYRVADCTDLVIEVNPRHVLYYVRLLKFDILGPERECPRVQGAPAVLLRGDVNVYRSEMMRVGGLGSACNERSLFPHFFAGRQESDFAQYLKQRRKPMTNDEKAYFGL